MLDEGWTAYDSFVSADQCDLGEKKNKKRCSSKNIIKRRFSDEQIRSLEVMFESETKLEPKKKMQIAKELGLQPRQVAIWFQNKRARWKSKHIEKQYNILLANYNDLANQFESLKKENMSLLTQLHKLKNEMKGTSDDDEKENYNRSGTHGESSDYYDDDEDDGGIKAELLGLQNHELVKMEETTTGGGGGGGDSSLTSADDWGSLDSGGDHMMINQPTESFQWWDFWS